MRDPEEHTAIRLKAMEAILQIAFPAKSVDHADLAETEQPGPRYLEVRFVDPDGTERPYGQARSDVAMIADEQPINDRRLVTPQRLPPPRMVRDAEQETTVLPAQAPRQIDAILARPNGKVPSWRARNAAGIFR